MQDTLTKLKNRDKEIQLLSHTIALLGWDQETCIPEKSVNERAEQISLVEGLIHDRVTSEDTGELFSLLGADERNPAGAPGLSGNDAAFIREFYRIYKKRMKLPKELVTEFAKVTSLAQAKWAEARSKSEFGIFAPLLERIVDLTRKKADCMGYSLDPYDPLLDDFEPWMKNSELASIFGKLEPELSALAVRIAEKSGRVAPVAVDGEFDERKQREISESIMKMMGFDFGSGRIDVSAHPFTATLGSKDVRITTRYITSDPVSNVYSTIHETGHALYEQGFGDELYGTLLANGASMGLHESQSRLWENMIGRSRGFSARILSLLKDAFPAEFANVTPGDFYTRMINRVKPSFIRTESDEVTYNLHIILRYNLETRLVRGELAVADLPAAWKAESRKLLGIEPSNDSDGALQDIHWSFGSIGYFPTYALGNLYSAQFYAKLVEDVPDADGESGSFADDTIADILCWLREKIHSRGCTLTAADLCGKVTDAPLDPNFFMCYLERKYGDIYGL
jgi:carboxypeptidase Taq